jgi:hypothetical protein
MFAIAAHKGASPHHKSFTEAAGTEGAHERALETGKLLSMVGWDVLTDDSFYQAVKADWEKQMSEEHPHEESYKLIAGCC